MKRCHQHPEQSRTCAPKARSIDVFGGVGRLEPFYRALVEGQGYELRYHERRVPGGTPPATLAGILVVSSKISHPLREHAARLAEASRVPIVYLRTPSVGAVQRGLAEIQEHHERYSDDGEKNQGPGSGPAVRARRGGR